LRLLVESCFEGAGQLPWSVKRIFVPESASARFVEAFVELAKSYPIRPLRTEKSEQEFVALAEKTRGEGAKILLGGEKESAGVRPTVALDLSHCSTLQQDPIDGPLALISPVKYLHEAVKWTNVGYLGLSHLILGDEEKALRTSEKLDCGHVWINQWISASDGVIVGAKQSSFGNMDFQPFGGFYSDRRKIVGASSKI
jgi:aminomuconate-semialdehyde/2-hydroxymuconate-6-semialdehyde dehydrogenase